MPMARTKLARLLFASALLALLSVYGYFCGLEWLAKWAFANQSYFAADELVLITVAQKDISSQTAYLLHEGEFEWQGDMVDVLHREVRSDTVYVYGFRDKAETQLKKQAAWLYKDVAHPYRRPNTRTKRVKWVSLINPLQQTLFNNLSIGSFIDTQFFFPYSSSRFSRPFLDVLYPPPNL